jgi:hypothetical protein
MINEDDYLDELYESRHRSFLQAKLRRLPAGDPDEGDLQDAIDELDEDDELA